MPPRLSNCGGRGKRGELGKPVAELGKPGEGVCWGAAFGGTWLATFGIVGLNIGY